MSTTLELYEQLKPKPGDAEARSLLEFIESSVERRAATKEDWGLLEERMKRELALLERRLKLDTAELKSDLIQWMFLFWMGQVVVTTLIMFILLKTVK